jgi:cytochrome c peroxidase
MIMRTSAQNLLICLAATSSIACGEDDFTASERAIIETLSPFEELPAAPTNRYADNEAAAALGQMLFFDRALAGPLMVDSDLGATGEVGKVACVDCHSNLSGDGFSDIRSVPNSCSNGANWTPRNAPSMLNMPYYEWFAWAGRGDTLWMKAMQPVEAPPSLGSSRLRVAHVVFDRYRAEYDAIFEQPLPEALDSAHADAARFPPDGKPKGAPDDPDGPWEMMAAEDQDAINRVFANVGKAFEAYFRKLVTEPGPFDDFVAGDEEAISAVAKEGLKLFVGKAACVDCHEGPTFTDNDFHNTGVPQVGDHVKPSDDGRYGAIGNLMANPFNSSGVYSDDTTTGKLDGVAATEADKGKFRTKNLRQIADTGPYMHTGHLTTLREVVEFYNDGGGTNEFSANLDPRIVPLNLTTEEIDAIVAFLETLSGPVPEVWARDTSKP